MQAHKNGEDLSQFTPKNKPEEELIAKLLGGNGGGSGGAEYVDCVTKTGPIEIGSTGDLYVDITAYTPEQIQATLSEAFNAHRGNYHILENEDYDISVGYDQGMIYNIYLENKETQRGNFLYSVAEYGGWNTEMFDFSKPIITGFKPLTSVGDYNYQLENMFYIGKNEAKLVANADITPEQLDELNTVEVVTPTETKVFGGSSSGPSMVVSPYNNPDLPNLYYGMDLMNKKLYVDFPKLAEYYKAKGKDLSMSLRNLGSGGMNLYIFSCACIMSNHDKQSIDHYFRIDGSGPSNGWEEVFGRQHADLNMTVEQLFNSYGTACLDLVKFYGTNFNPESKIMVILDGILDVDGIINLNEKPIDFIWFE
jgi:hypothetical protein